jgi:5'-nucleotidase
MLAAITAAVALAVTPLALVGAADAAPTAGPAGASGSLARHPKPRTPIKLDLLAINDFHGNLEKPTGSSGRITTGLDANGAPINVEAGGAARLATTLDELRAASRAAGARTLTVAAGDLIGASPLLSGAFHDEPTIEALNLMGLDIASVGNHEFDEGWRELLRMQYGGCLDDGDGAAGQNSCPNEGEPFTGADFRYLAANVRFEKSKRTVFPSYVIRRIDGAKVAFIGMTLENTPNIVTKSATEGLEFTDEVETVNRVVPQLKRQGVRAMVVLLHEGMAPGNSYTPNGCPLGETPGPGYDIARTLHPAIDVVVSGHTHAAYNCVVQDRWGNNRLFTSASSFGRLVTKIPLQIDRRSEDIIRPAAASPATNVIVTQDKAERADILSLIARYNELVAPIRDEVIGQLAGATQLDRAADANGGDSPLGNLIADSQRSDPSVVTGGQVPVIAFMNPGGIRADLVAPGGQVTYGAAFTVQPFNNYVTSITLTGKQIRDVLNEQWNLVNEATPRILQVSGLSYTWDRSLAAQPTTDALVGNVLVDLDRNGTAETPLDPATSYRVVVNSFLVEGGDGFPTLALGTDRFFGGLDIDSLRQFLALPANTPYTPTATDRISAID